MAHLKPRSTTVLLYQGDDMDQLAHLKRKLDHAKRQAAARAEGGAARFDDSDDGDATVASAQADYDTFVDGAAERALDVEVRSIGRRRFRDLIAEHPPRMIDGEPDADGKVAKVVHEDDDGWSVNVSTFPEALLCYRDDDVLTIAKPEFKNKAEVQAFVDNELADGDFDDLWTAAYWLNRSPSADPFAHRSSAGPSSESTSTSPEAWG